MISACTLLVASVSAVVCVLSMIFTLFLVLVSDASKDFPPKPEKKKKR